MMTLRPKHNLESVIGTLATGLSSGTIQLSTDSSVPSRVRADEEPPSLHYALAGPNRNDASPRSDNKFNPQVSSSSKK